eukprot:4337537-Pyramimonas_sp.AAC.1
MRELGLHTTALHGGAHGLRDRKGNFMEKPWTSVSTSSIVPHGFERRRGARVRVWRRASRAAS